MKLLLRHERQQEALSAVSQPASTMCQPADASAPAAPAAQPVAVPSQPAAADGGIGPPAVGASVGKPHAAISDAPVDVVADMQPPPSTDSAAMDIRQHEVLQRTV